MLQYLSIFLKKIVHCFFGLLTLFLLHLLNCTVQRSTLVDYKASEYDKLYTKEDSHRLNPGTDSISANNIMFANTENQSDAGLY